MKKFIFGIIALVALVVAAYSYWEEHREYKEVKWTKHGRGVESPEDIERQKGFDYDKVELRRLFETSYKEAWTISCGDPYTVEYPQFMFKGKESDSSAMFVYYNDISMKALVYKDEYDMTIEEKYEALSASAVTKSIDEKGFMMAGRMGEDMRFFEKHLFVKPRTWLYLRVEFPKDQTWAADPLLQYVKAYEPYYLSQALRPRP